MDPQDESLNSMPLYRSIKKITDNFNDLEYNVDDGYITCRLYFGKHVKKISVDTLSMIPS